MFPVIQYEIEIAAGRWQHHLQWRSEPVPSSVASGRLLKKWHKPAIGLPSRLGAQENTQAFASFDSVYFYHSRPFFFWNLVRKDSSAVRGVLQNSAARLQWPHARAVIRTMTEMDAQYGGCLAAW
jgi:hypothetical protein